MTATQSDDSLRCILVAFACDIIKHTRNGLGGKDRDVTDQPVIGRQRMRIDEVKGGDDETSRAFRTLGFARAKGSSEGLPAAQPVLLDLKVLPAMDRTFHTVIRL